MKGKLKAYNSMKLKFRSHNNWKCVFDEPQSTYNIHSPAHTHTHTSFKIIIAIVMWNSWNTENKKQLKAIPKI